MIRFLFHLLILQNNLPPSLPQIIFSFLAFAIRIDSLLYQITELHNCMFCNISIRWFFMSDRFRDIWWYHLFPHIYHGLKCGIHSASYEKTAVFNFQQGRGIKCGIYHTGSHVALAAFDSFKRGNNTTTFHA